MKPGHLLLGAVATALLLSGCAPRTVVGVSFTPRVFSPGGNDMGIPRCDPAAAADPLSPAALQCWFTAAHGRWRTITHEEHLTEVVVHVETVDLDDAREIAQTFVAAENDRFTEISVYAQKEGSRGGTERRVTWTRDSGFRVMDFRGGR